MSRPKVCHLLHDGSGQGGGATFALAYFPAYNAEFETLAIVGNDGNLAERLRARGVRTLSLGMSRPLKALFSLRKLIRILRREKPAVAIVHGQWGGFFGSIAAACAGIKVVIYYTQFPSFYSDWDLLRVVRNRIAEKVTCRLSTWVVCLSSAGRYQYLMRRLAPEAKIIHISNGLNPGALTATVDRSILLKDLSPASQPNDQIVVAVGRLAYQKRIDCLLRAWSVVEKQNPRARLAIIGSGPEDRALQSLAQSLGLQRCRFLGARSNGYSYFRVADCGVICSLFEGQPLALIEAMFVGCPMIGTVVDGIGETIVDRETGLLVPPVDIPALSEAILTMLSDPKRARAMADAARKRAEELYHLDVVVGRQIQLVKDSLARAA
jgi:glycosyltransferase involved in cell wall biosynthesis